MAQDLLTLLLLVALQAVLGFDNLLYISLESKRAPADKQNFVRKFGIGLAIVLRIILLFVLVKIVKMLEEPFASIHNEYFEAAISGHALIVLGGGAFILYTAVKEIWHMMSIEHGAKEEEGKASVGKIITMIVIMNLVFSFDSILSAMALTEVMWVMVAAIIISGIMMIALAEKVSNFLRKNRMYEVLGLFVLFIVGIMLVTEGGHLAHISILGEHVVPMSKTTFYFVLVVLVLVDIVQGRYQKKIAAELDAAAQS